MDTQDSQRQGSLRNIALAFFAVLGISLLAIWLVFRESPTEDLRPNETPESARENWTLKRDPIKPLKLEGPAPSGAPNDEAPELATTQEKPDLSFGSILVVAEDSTLPEDQDRRLAHFDIRIVPAVGRFIQHGVDGTEITDVPPGDYYLDLWAAGFVATSTGQITVLPGQQVKREVKLQRGIQLAGRVVDEKTHQGVENAVIRFGNFAMARSDRDGRFAVPASLPDAALTTISTSHPDYDDVTEVRRGVQPEFASDMIIALTRGDSEIDGIVFDPQNRITEETKLTIELTLVSGPIPQTRRKFDVSGPRFKVKNVNAGTYVLTVRFPQMGIPDRRVDLTIGYKDRAPVEITLTSGATISGLLTLDKGRPIAARIELLDSKGVGILSTTSDSVGEFQISEVPDGQYRFRVWRGTPYFNTQPITVERKRDQRVEIQTLRSRWIPKEL